MNNGQNFQLQNPIISPNASAIVNWPGFSGRMVQSVHPIASASVNLPIFSKSAVQPAILSLGVNIQIFSHNVITPGALISPVPTIVNGTNFYQNVGPVGQNPAIFFGTTVPPI